MKIFVSYSHRDAAFRDRLETHLAPLRRAGLVSVWHDRRIGPGEDWERAIDKQIHDSDIILLLVSANFIESDYCWEHEVAVALQRHERGEAIVVPILLSHCDWTLAPFAALQALPTAARPIAGWQRRDEAYADVARALRGLIQNASLSARTQHISEATEPRATEKPFRIQAITLGSISISVDGRLISNTEWGSLKAVELFLYLLTFGTRGVSKESAMMALYPDFPNEKLNSAFHSNLYRVRRVLFQDSVMKMDSRYVLSPNAEIDWDVENVRVAYNQAKITFSPNYKVPVDRQVVAHQIKNLRRLKNLRRHLLQFAPGINSVWVHTIREELAGYANAIDIWYR
jgi:hypothetical protein